jgi:AraC family transcriptional regulator, regulatory protein of adaptative response / methylated-DNA-[protein]-cysteine methyltransferase
MNNENLVQQADDYRIVEQAIRFLEGRFREQPGLDEIAASVNLSKYHFQRLFKRWAGISPTQFLHYLTVEYAKERLRESESVLGATLDAGLSSAGRLHDLFVTLEAVTPGEYRRQGAGLRIAYGFHDTPFGRCLAATTARGLCALQFVQEGDGEEALAILAGLWPRAALAEETETTAPLVEGIFSTEGERTRPFHLLLKGTNFQVKVWQALLAIPPGAMVSYQDVAAYIGAPKASRAVGRAVAENPVAYLIPCHRVITSAGEAHRYRWGTARKKAMLGREAATLEPGGRWTGRKAQEGV